MTSNNDANKLFEREFINLVHQWLNIHWRNRLCLLCGNNHWTIYPKQFTLREDTGIGLVISPQVLQLKVVPVQCNDCGHVLLFNIPVQQINPMVIQFDNQEPLSRNDLT